METTLKMQIVQFSPAVYWTRVVIFLLPFLHTISENNEHSFFKSINMYLVNPLIYVAMSKLFRRQLRTVSHLL